MIKKQNTKIKTVNKKQKAGSAVTGSKQLKTNLKQLYKELENYFAVNVYYETVQKEHPNRLIRLLLSRVVDVSKAVGKPSVLELGLNPGILSIEVALKNAKAFGVDTSPMKVVIAENLKHIEYDKFELIQKVDNYKLPIENLLTCKFQVNNFNDLSFKDGQFDIIFSNDSLENTGIQEVLDEAVRCLKTNGELIISLDFTEKQYMDSNNSELLTFNSIETWAAGKNMQLLSSIEVRKKIANTAFLNVLKFFRLLSLFEGKVTQMVYHLKKN